MTEAECRGDQDRWAWRGEYDAVQGDQPWIASYAQLCSRRYGTAVDAEGYMKGWEIGHAAFERRVNIAN